MLICSIRWGSPQPEVQKVMFFFFDTWADWSLVCQFIIGAHGSCFRHDYSFALWIFCHCLWFCSELLFLAFVFSGAGVCFRVWSFLAFILVAAQLLMLLPRWTVFSGLTVIVLPCFVLLALCYLFTSINFSRLPKKKHLFT